MEHRYTESGDTYTLHSWSDDGSHKVMSAYIASRPEWLELIVTVATVGGHIRNIQSPPPNRVLWFETDNNRKLIRIITL